MVIDQRRGNVLGLVVPNFRHGWQLFRTCDDIFIPYNNICKIGDDVILVELFCDSNNEGRNNRKGPRCQSTTTEEATQDNGEDFDEHPTYSGKMK